MAMIKCRECGNRISNESENCVHCGCSTTPVGDIDKRCIQCGAWLRNNYCPRCGYSAVKSKQTRRTMVIVLLVIALICVSAMVILLFATPTAFTSPSTPTSVVHQQSGISLAQFNAVEMGMTYQEVCNILGSDGELLSEVDIDMGAEYVTKIYMWKGNALGANANITFQGGKVSVKAQFGLR